MPRLTRGLSIYALVTVIVCGLGCAGTAQPKAKKSLQTDVIAQVGDRTFSLQEVDERAKIMNAKAYQALYDARRQALDLMIEEHLLDQEADSRGISKEQLIEEAITKQAKPVTDEDVNGYFNQNRTRFGGRTLEQLGAQIRSYLAAQNLGAARQEFLSQLRSATDVRIDLEPPRVEVTIAANEPSLGPASAKVAIVGYSDFQ